MRRVVVYIFKISILLCIFIQSGIAAQRVSVFVSIPPQKYFVQQIGRDLVDIQVMVQPGASPATYEPQPRQMAGLSGARLYFAIGVPFENAWLGKIAAANPKMKIVQTDDGIEKIPMSARHHHDEATGHKPKGMLRNDSGHDYGKAGDQAEARRHVAESDRHETRDPHIWLSPRLVMVQAGLILNALQEIDPPHRGVYAANYSAFMTQIVELDIELKNIFAGKEGLEFMVFHPSWGYFADAYGLAQVPVEIEGKDPKPARLKEVIEHAREKGIRVIFVQPQFSTKSAKLVAREIGGQVVFTDPLAEDWLSNLRQAAGQFRKALR